MVILVIPTALKVDGVGPWVHHSHVRQASQQEQEEAREWIAQRHPNNPLKQAHPAQETYRATLHVTLNTPLQ
jgi:hypothetical protein